MQCGTVKAGAGAAVGDEATVSDAQNKPECKRPKERRQRCRPGSAPGPAAPRVMLLCGADMVESFLAPGVWRPEHLRTILGDDHGVVCVAR